MTAVNKRKLFNYFSKTRALYFVEHKDIPIINGYNLKTKQQ